MSKTLPQFQNGETPRNSRLFQVLAVVCVGIFILFSSDMLEIKSETSIEDVELKNHSYSSNDTTTTTTLGSLEEKEDDETQPPLPPRRTYLPRGRVWTGNGNVSTLEGWGSWTFVDPHPEVRPMQDYYQDYPNRDIPRDQFPKGAWQVDNEYLGAFLPQAIQLVVRAQTAIQAEYGINYTLPNGVGIDDIIPTEMPDMFRVFQYQNTSTLPEKGSSRGGWTTTKSWQGLKRRLLHAIMTEDSFIFAMGGHSAAAGHGNHFQQSYTLQVQWILESVFARLGVYHQSRNFGNGGLGTIHNAIAGGSIYGPDVDILMWDSGMTENNNRPKELFHRQGLIGGIKVPILWTRDEKIALEMNSKAGIDIGIPGSGMKGVSKIREYNEMMSKPYASRYLDCGGEVKDICKGQRYDGVCWIDRPDVTPEKAQEKFPGGRASWHPGNLEHQIFGRVVTFSILEALKEALIMWRESPGYVLPDEAWHLTEYFNVQREALSKIDRESSHCKNFKENGLDHICEVPVKGRTEFTPRNKPDATSIRSLMSPAMREQIGLGSGTPNIYEPPDVFNPSLHPPKGEIDVLSIVEAGVPFGSTLSPKWADSFYKKPRFEKPSTLPVGKGIHLSTKAGDEFCDGTVDSWCSRGASESCLLRAHNDGRNGLLFDSLSGWIIMNIPDVKHGDIIVKFETWHQPGSAFRTKDWTTINNEKPPEQTTNGTTNSSAPATEASADESIASPASNNTSRALKKKKNPPPLCKDFRFQYSIDGKITTLNAEEFKQQKQDVARVVEMLVLLQDTNYTKGVETEVEAAIRIIGCGRTNTFKLTHVYWT